MPKKKRELITQSELARRLGCSRQNVGQKVKNGTIPLHSGKIDYLEALEILDALQDPGAPVHETQGSRAAAGIVPKNGKSTSRPAELPDIAVPVSGLPESEAEQIRREGERNEARVMDAHRAAMEQVEAARRPDPPPPPAVDLMDWGTIDQQGRSMADPDERAMKLAEAKTHREIVRLHHDRLNLAKELGTLIPYDDAVRGARTLVTVMLQVIEPLADELERDYKIAPEVVLGVQNRVIRLREQLGQRLTELAADWKP